MDAADRPLKPALATAPSPAVRAELVGILERDVSRVGDVYRLREEGQDAEQIRARLGQKSAGFVSNNDAIIRTLLNGQAPAAAHVADIVTAKLRSLLKREHLSPDAQAYLRGHLVAMEESARTRDRSVGKHSATRRTKEAERQQAPGIYVYAYPHYLRHPYEPATGKTLMKVGHSGSDVIRRFMQQKRSTVVPEEPVLLRIYHTGEQSAVAVEKFFHDVHRSLGDYVKGGRVAGREWFLTTTTFLDQVAATHRVDIEVITDAWDPVD